MREAHDPPATMTGLLKGIRPELEDLQEFLGKAGCGMIRGIPLTAMSRDELLALAAMLIQREAARSEPLQLSSEVQRLRRPDR